MTGNSEPITICGVFDADPPELKASKLKVQLLFEQAIAQFNNRDYTAASLLQACLYKASRDSIAQICADRCLYQNRQ